MIIMMVLKKKKVVVNFKEKINIFIEFILFFKIFYF
jgi:hypothetical protein